MPRAFIQPTAMPACRRSCKHNLLMDIKWFSLHEPAGYKGPSCSTPRVANACPCSCTQCTSPTDQRGNKHSRSLSNHVTRHSSAQQCLCERAPARVQRGNSVIPVPNTWRHFLSAAFPAAQQAVFCFCKVFRRPGSATGYFSPERGSIWRLHHGSEVRHVIATRHACCAAHLV